MACLKLKLLRRQTWSCDMQWLPLVVAKLRLYLQHSSVKRALGITQSFAHISQDLFSYILLVHMGCLAVFLS